MSNFRKGAKIDQIDNLIAEISKIPDDWHRAGTVSERVLKKIVEHLADRKILNSAETGAGKTTLLFSHISLNHKVFAMDMGESLSAVRSCDLLNSESVEFIEGPTQLTLKTYKLIDKLQVVIIDGPHGYPFPDMEYWYFYPHIEEGGLLIIDDIHIPTIHNLFVFLKEDDMFDLVEIVGTTAFFRRNANQLLDPYGDGWWLQNYNNKRFPVGFYQKLMAFIPSKLQRKLISLIKHYKM